MIDNEDIDRLKEVFVTRRECQETTSSIETKISKDNVRLSVIETEVHQIKWLVGTVLAASLVTLVNSIATLIGG